MNNRDLIWMENALTEGVFAIPLLETMVVLNREADQKMETVNAQDWSKLIALGPITGLMITQENGLGLSIKWHDLLVFLDNQDTHCRDSLGGTFLPKGAIFTQGKALEGAQACNATLFLEVALEPNLPIRMGCRKILKERGRAVPMEVDRTDNTGNRIECRRRGG